MEGDERVGAPLYERDPAAWRAHLAEGNAKQARKRVSADVLVRDRAGRFLIVKPTYKPGWDLPGGMAEANEPPLGALRRELAEELGLKLPSYRLLCLDWVPPHGPWDDMLAFVFDGGMLEDEQCHLSLGDGELSEYTFSQVDRLAELLDARLWRRVKVALDVLNTNSGPRYLQDGHPV